MGSTSFPRFFPHPRHNASAFEPVKRPLTAYDINHMFLQETEDVLVMGIEARGLDYQRLHNQAVHSFITQKRDDDLLLLCLYREFLANSVRDGNGDGVWKKESHYQDLVSSPAMSVLASWMINGFFVGIGEFLESAAPAQNLLQREGSLYFLLHPLRMNVSLAASSETQEETFEETLRTELSSLNANVRRLTVMTERSGSTLPKPDGEFPGERERKPLRLENATLENVLDTILIQQNDDHPLGPQNLTVAWFAPPPVSPSGLYRFEGLSPSETVFLTETFLDVYQTQTALLTLQFFTARMDSLWSRAEGIIEPALYSQEIPRIKTGMSNLVHRLEELFTPFLALEGFTVMGQKLKDLLGPLFPEQEDKAGNVLPILDIKAFLEESLEVVRNACVLADRLRVSLLYGQGHPSYVGDLFLQSYYYRSYMTRHTTAGLSTLIATVTAFDGLNLPSDPVRQADFYQSLYDGSRLSAGRRGIREPVLRQGFPCLDKNLQPKGIRTTVPMSGPLESLYPPSRDGAALFGLAQRMWSQEAVLPCPEEDLEP